MSPSLLPFARRPRQAAMTLVEVMVSAGVLTLVSAGLLAMLIQSRRLTEASIYQNSAVTAMQGYLEQMKNMEFNELPFYDGAVLKRGNITTADDIIYTRLDNDTPDYLELSAGAIPDMDDFRSALSAAVQGVIAGTQSRTTPITLPDDFETGPIDNVKVIDINNTPTAFDDLILHTWVWITPLEDAGTGVAASRTITLVYSWMFNDGRNVRSGIDSVRTIRSAVPTF